MTPTTTPAPMTHEGDDVFIPKPCCIRADGACFEEGECLSDCEALDLDLLRGASERELRQRLERAERDRNDWRTRADALDAEVESLRSRVDAAERERDAWMTEAKLLEHKTITCGVAATHPDADLTTRYPAEWDSPQHQAVRALRAKCAELEAGIGRQTDLARAWRNRFVSELAEHRREAGDTYEWARAHAEAAANEFEDEFLAARSLLRITHEEGRDGL